MKTLRHISSKHNVSLLLVADLLLLAMLACNLPTTAGPTPIPTPIPTPTSPLLRQLAFSSERDGNMEIYLMNEDGTEQVNLTDNQASGGGMHGPRWIQDSLCLGPRRQFRV